ncbi:4-hydroxybenzoate polyprenyltransferase, mitochondrial [Maniola hyperantus]|uniref:4-hydroxybenzoate polyprenyltransferase, mitochondrial n=1 Tax=Aphantopus hyperantus TaxID=2795564 RepID=UPI00156960AB|nr:4-hydroxybenzoate polyprenyltransferase, mitochondrial [Maniola hyperantus]
MLNTIMRSYKRLGLYHILKYARKQYNISNTIRWKSCSCGNMYFTNQRLYENRLFIRNTRMHSTQSEHHRQKVVIETSTPKIVIDKIKVEESTNENTTETSLGLFWREKIDPYIKLSRWDKPTGVYLLYWPCSWSIALASLPGNVPLSTSVETAALFLAGAGLMRGAGCTINDLWDRDIDAKVERTKDRPLVSGAISEKQAIAFLAAQLTLGLGVLLQLNCYSVVLGASSMILVITYPLAKRFTNYPQIFLGATFNWGALLGYSAIQGYIEPVICVPLYLSALAWTVVYDTIYAHQDKRDDARLGIKSTALTFGAHTKPALSGALAVSLCGMTLAGHAVGLAAPYYAALAAYAAHAGLQIYTLKPDNPDDCAKKFKSNSMVGLIILLGILGGGYQQYIDNRQKHRGKEDLSVARSCFFS